MTRSASPDVTYRSSVSDVDETEDPLAYYERRLSEPLRAEQFPDDLSEAMRREPHWGRLIKWFLRDNPLGDEGERMLAEANAESERNSVVPLDDQTRAVLSNLNEAAVREHLGLPRVPTL